MPPLSLHHLTMIEASPVQLVEAAAAGGFDHCGLRLVAPRPGDPLADIAGDRDVVRQVERRLRHAGVRLLDIEAVWLGPETDMETLRQPLEVGASLGARYVLTVGNDDNRERFAETFARFCDLAAGIGLIVMLEFITYCAVNSLAEARRVVEGSGRANAGILIDTLQFFRSGAEPAALDGLPASAFPYMQLCDGLRAAPATLEARRHEARTDRRLPGEGELPVAELLRHLPPGIPLSLEAPTAALRGLPHGEQGRLAGEAVRRFLAGAGLQVPYS
jgi:sugar phosphate isomerase/epimerase